MLMVSSKGILVKRESTSRLAIYSWESCFRISSAKANESLTVNSLDVKGAKMGTKNLASLYAGVPIADKIGRNGGQPPTLVL